MKGHIHGVIDMKIICIAYRKRVNAKVRNYDLRDLDNEMNRKA